MARVMSSTGNMIRFKRREAIRRAGQIVAIEKQIIDT